jgi:hypothetical protein
MQILHDLLMEIDNDKHQTCWHMFVQKAIHLSRQAEREGFFNATNNTE